MTDNDDNDFNCPVCMELLATPATLECGHTMCSECALQLSKLQCAVCRSPFRQISKNLLLDMVMQKQFGQKYIDRCMSSNEILLRYYNSARYNTLTDIVTDVVASGTIVNDTELDEFCTQSQIIDRIKATLDYSYYEPPEIRLCIQKLLIDKTFIQVEQFILLNDTCWISDNLVRIGYMYSDTMILGALTPILKKESEHYALSTYLSKKRKRDTMQFHAQSLIPTITIEENERLVSELLKSNKISRD